MVRISLVTRPDQARRRVAKVLFWNWEMYTFFSLIGTNICLKLQNVFVFCCNTNIFVQNGGMYLFHITKGICFKLQKLSKKSKSFWCLCKLIYDQCYQCIVELLISFIDAEIVTPGGNVKGCTHRNIPPARSIPPSSGRWIFICDELGLVRRAPLYNWPGWKGIRGDLTLRHIPPPVYTHIPTSGYPLANCLI